MPESGQPSGEGFDHTRFLEEMSWSPKPTWGGASKAQCNWGRGHTWELWGTDFLIFWHSHPCCLVFGFLSHSFLLFTCLYFLPQVWYCLFSLRIWRTQVAPCILFFTLHLAPTAISQRLRIAIPGFAMNSEPDSQAMVYVLSPVSAGYGVGLPGGTQGWSEEEVSSQPQSQTMYPLPL